MTAVHIASRPGVRRTAATGAAGAEAVGGPLLRRRYRARVRLLAVIGLVSAALAFFGCAGTEGAEDAAAAEEAREQAAEGEEGLDEQVGDGDTPEDAADPDEETSTVGADTSADGSAPAEPGQPQEPTERESGSTASGASEREADSTASGGAGTDGDDVAVGEAPGAGGMATGDTGPPRASDIDAILDMLHEPVAPIQYVRVYGYDAAQRAVWVVGSVSKYLFADLDIVDRLVPVDDSPYAGQEATEEVVGQVEPLKLIRPGITRSEVEAIVFHDTGNAFSWADAAMHAAYMASADNRAHRARSWHYTVDDGTIIRHIPDNEVAWHGDDPMSYVSAVGIETCVNEGADHYLTWQRAAKLIADLLVTHGLSEDAVLEHFETSGKNCPKTARMNGLFTTIRELIHAEYLVRSRLSEYEIELVDFDERYIDATGRVHTVPETATTVSYSVRYTRDGVSTTAVYQTLLPGVDGSGRVPFSGEP